VPIYRNADTLRELHRQLRVVLDSYGLPFEIIFIDDACPDGSLPVLEFIAQADRHVRVVSLGKNIGQHHAALVGIACSLGEWVVIMDADLQDSPEMIPRLVSKGQEGFSAVFAGRRGRFQSRFRLLTSRVFKQIIHGLCRVPTDAGMFIALNRALVERLLSMRGTAPSLPVMIGCAAYPVISIPVERANRLSGKSAYTVPLLLRQAWRSLSWLLAWKVRTAVYGTGLLERPASGRQPFPANVEIVRCINLVFSDR
jgi:glycosyltransferase involved in cell wall biosynthesis